MSNLRQRRYSITKAESELIILALSALIEDLETNEAFQDSIYWNWNLQAAKELRRKLIDYKWEV